MHMKEMDEKKGRIFHFRNKLINYNTILFVYLDKHNLKLIIIEHIFHLIIAISDITGF